MKSNAGHCQPPGEPASALSPIDRCEELAAVCRAALSISEELANQLRRGIPAHAMLSLLHKEAELAGQLRSGIARLQHEPQSPDFTEQRKRLLEQVKTLLIQEQDNYRLMCRRGVKLSNTRPYRYAPRRP